MPKKRKPDDLPLADAEVEIARLRGYVRDLKAEKKRLVRKVIETEERFDALASIREVRGYERRRLVASRGQKHEAVPIVTWSDWHVAEVVDPAKVQKRNRYTPEIARERSRRCAENTVKLLRGVRKQTAVESAVLVLGGDFITGYLHPELAETNAMGPVKEARYAEELLLEALWTVAAEPWLKRLRVVCHRGNHGRTTKKIQFKNDYETSLESWIYWHLADVMKAVVTLEFDVPQGDVAHTEIDAGFVLRTFHGQQVRYRDGVGGVAIPLNKWQAKQDRTRPAQFNVMGHYHQFSFPNSSTLLNGSLKGWDEYAASAGFSYEPALQAMAVYDRRRAMVTGRFPIFCE